MFREAGVRSRQLPPYQQHVVQQFQVAIGTFPAIVQGSKPHIRGHFWVVGCFLYHRVIG